MRAVVPWPGALSRAIVPPWSVDDLAGQGEAEAEAGVLGGEVGLEGASGSSSARHAVAVSRTSTTQRLRLRRASPRRTDDREHAALGHGVDGVDHQVQEAGLQQLGVGHDARAGRLRRPPSARCPGRCALWSTSAATSRRTSSTEHGRGSRRIGLPKDRKSPDQPVQPADLRLHVAEDAVEVLAPLRVLRAPGCSRTWSIERLMKFSGLRISWATAEARRPMRASSARRSAGAPRARGSRAAAPPSR